MTLRSRPLERRLRRRIRQEIRRSPALRKERQAFRKARRTTSNFAIAVFVGVMFGMASVVRLSSPEAMLGWASLAITALALHHGAVLRSYLFHGGDLLVFWHLPISAAQIFTVQWRKYWRQSLWWLLFVAGLIVMMGWKVDHPGWTWWGAVIWVGLQWVLGMTVGVLLAAYKRLQFPTGVLIAVVFLFPLGTIFAPEGWLTALDQGLAKIHHSVGWFLPAGWINHLFYRGAVLQQADALWLAIPIGILLAWLPHAREKLAKDYAVPLISYALPSVPLVLPTEEAASALESLVQTQAPTTGLTEITERIQARELFKPAYWWQLGWLERGIAGWLSQREQTLAEFMLARWPEWSKAWHWALLIAAGGSLLGWFTPVGREVVLGFAAVMAMSIGLPIAGGVWPALMPVSISGLNQPFYAAYPLGFREMAPVFFKVNLMRCAVFLPIASLFGMGGLARLGFSPAYGAVLALKAVLLVLLWQPILFAFRLSAGTNDSQRVNLFVAAFAGLALALAGFSAGFLFATSLHWSLINGSATAVISIGACLLYRRRYEGLKFDLLNQQRPYS